MWGNLGVVHDLSHTQEQGAICCSSEVQRTRNAHGCILVIAARDVMTRQTRSSQRRQPPSAIPRSQLDQHQARVGKSMSHPSRLEGYRNSERGVAAKGNTRGTLSPLQREARNSNSRAFSGACTAPYQLRLEVRYINDRQQTARSMCTIKRLFPIDHVLTVSPPPRPVADFDANVTPRSPWLAHRWWQQRRL